MSQLNLVDLAGSEGASRTQTDGLRLREGSNINRSLLALSNVINRLSSAPTCSKTFINYRDSKLTRILQTALGGNSKTAIICTVTQTLSNYQETVNTLHFGQKAKHVKTTVNVNEISSLTSGPEMDKALKEILHLKQKLKDFESKILEMEGMSQ
jgi:centromeric protein E